MTFETVLHGVEASGHHLLLEFEKFYFRVAFALHGQVVGAGESSFQEIYKSDSVAWQLAIKTRQPHPVVLVFADYNKVCQYWMVFKESPTCHKWEMGRNCDPMDSWSAYATNILLDLPRLQRLRTKTILEAITSDKLFNGFGLNHTTEALHCALIHPMISASTVFNDPIIRKRLLDALCDISQLPQDWEKYIPKLPNLNSPFEFNEAAWKYYNGTVNKVYRKGSVLVPMLTYKTLLQLHLVLLNCDG